MGGEGIIGVKGFSFHSSLEAELIKLDFALGGMHVHCRADAALLVRQNAT